MSKWEEEFETTLYFDYEETVLRDYENKKYCNLEELLLYYLGYNPNYLTVTDKVKIKARKGTILIERVA